MPRVQLLSPGRVSWRFLRVVAHVRLSFLIKAEFPSCGWATLWSPARLSADSWVPLPFGCCGDTSLLQELLILELVKALHECWWPSHEIVQFVCTGIGDCVYVCLKFLREEEIDAYSSLANCDGIPVPGRFRFPLSLLPLSLRPSFFSLPHSWLSLCSPALSAPSFPLLLWWTWGSGSMCRESRQHADMPTRLAGSSSPPGGAGSLSGCNLQMKSRTEAALHLLREEGYFWLGMIQEASAGVLTGDLSPWFGRSQAPQRWQRRAK